VSLGDWKSAHEKASQFVAKLNTTEKIKLITGSSVTTTNGETFTALDILDGDMGAQAYYYVSAFSLSSALAMTWDKEAMYEQGRAIAAEFYGKGIQMVAGPTSQPLGRTPWGGRLVESFGPDPYLNGIATGLETRAYADVGVIAGAKVSISPDRQITAYLMRFSTLSLTSRRPTGPAAWEVAVVLLVVAAWGEALSLALVSLGACLLQALREPFHRPLRPPAALEWVVEWLVAVLSRPRRPPALPTHPTPMTRPSTRHTSGPSTTRSIPALVV
jgi:hypothetical protein